MDEKLIFANRLNYYMERHGKTQADLIADLGVNKSTISTWCNGLKMPRMGTIQTLADYFGVMKSDLIEEKPAAGNGNELILSDNDKAVIERFNNLSPADKEKMMSYLDFLTSQGN